MVQCVTICDRERSGKRAGVGRARPWYGHAGGSTGEKYSIQRVGIGTGAGILGRYVAVCVSG